MGYIKRLINKLHKHWAMLESDRYIDYLREKGVTIGENCHFFGRHLLFLDLTRPSLIEIGNKVMLTRGVMLLTHGYEWCVLRELHGEVIGKSGAIKIEDNVFVGNEAKIMPGVTVGKNSIIGVGSIVTKDVEPNSVMVGIPAKKIMSIDEFYEHRKKKYKEEAKEYAYSIWKNLNRRPVPEEFIEFFPLFLERDESKFGGVPVKYQTKEHYRTFMESEPEYASFEEFLKDAGIPE